jgi:chorismate mutase
LPPSIGVYRIVKDKEFTVEQLAILRAARREHVHERLVALVGEGKILASQAVQMYKRLMDEAEEGKV